MFFNVCWNRESNSKTTKMLAILMANDDDDYDNNEDNKSAEKSKCFFMKGKRKLFEKTCLWFSFQVRFHFVYLSLDQQQKTTVSTSLAQRTASMTNHTRFRRKPPTAARPGDHIS